MSEFYTDYKKAHSAAVQLARQLGRQVGIEACREYGKPGFRVHHLPRPEKRQGFELRCEVINPEDPL